MRRGALASSKPASSPHRSVCFADRTSTALQVLNCATRAPSPRAPRPASAQIVRVWSHAAPGSERWTQRETTEQTAQFGTVVFKVVTPTIAAFLPARVNAIGVAVIIAPGGSFRGVTIGMEGDSVASWFQQHGIAAFVLKYRVLDYHAPGNSSLSIDAAARFAIADGIQALSVVRRHAVEGLRSPSYRLRGFLRRRHGGEQRPSPARRIRPP
jgi:hypothetical protein